MKKEGTWRTIIRVCNMRINQSGGNGPRRLGVNHEGNPDAPAALKRRGASVQAWTFQKQDLSGKEAEKGRS